MNKKFFYIFLTVVILGNKNWSYFPDGMYFFDFIPDTIEYFVSESGDKIRFRRILDMTENNFYFNSMLQIFSRNEEFNYHLKFSVSDEGDIFLMRIDDGFFSADFSKPLFILPRASAVEKPFDQKIGNNISLSKIKAVQPKGVSFRLLLGAREYILHFEYLKGLQMIKTPDDVFKRTTLRVFNLTKYKE